MKRFKTIVSFTVLSIEKDNLNNTYAVFIKCNRFKQQISKSYVKYGWAYKAMLKQLNTFKIYN